MRLISFAAERLNHSREARTGFNPSLTLLLQRMHPALPSWLCWSRAGGPERRLVTINIELDAIASGLSFDFQTRNAVASCWSIQSSVTWRVAPLLSTKPTPLDSQSVTAPPSLRQA